MIYLAGIVESVLTIDGQSISLTPSGYLFNLACELRKNVDPCIAILSRLSSDGPGRITLEKLVHEKIVFDPNLISPSLPSYLIVDDREGRKIVYSASSAPVTVSEEEILESLRSNSDVDIVTLVAGALWYQPLFNSLLDAASFVSPRPVIALDVSSDTYEWTDQSRLVRQIKTACQSADIMILTDADLSLFENDVVSSLAPAVAIVHSDASVDFWKNGSRTSFTGGKAEVYRRLINKEI